MTIFDVVTKLTDHEIRFRVSGDKLNVRAPKGAMTPELEQLIRDNKERLIEIFSEDDHEAVVPVAEVSDHYVLSSAQKRQYFLQQYDLDSVAYNLPQFLKLTGPLDVLKLQSAFQGLMDRHESFRTRFELHQEGPVQFIKKELIFDLEVTESNEKEVPKLIRDFVRPFDLSQAPLLRAEVLKLADEEHILMVDMHHIVSDGVSMNILTHELMSLYHGEVLPTLQLQYKDFAVWQHGAGNSEKSEKERNFWLKQYQDLPEPLRLPTDYARPVVRSLEGGTVQFTLSSLETEGLRQLAQKEGATMYMVVLSVFNVLLSRVTNQQDIVVGTPTAGRFNDDLLGIVGMFVNTLPLRNRPSGDKQFDAFLREVKAATLGCFDHQSYQYEALIDDLEVARDTGRNPLFDVLFAYENASDFDDIEVQGLSISRYEDDITRTAKFDLTLAVAEDDDQLLISLSYAADLFDKETIVRFSGYFQQIVAAVTSDASVKLSEINILAASERTQLLDEFNETGVDYPKDKTLIDLFDAQVARTPVNVALSHNDQRLTYSELDERANQLANYLQSEGLQPKELVGFMLERSPEMIVAILAILKSGAAYLPLDIKNPPARNEKVLTNSGSKMLIAGSSAVDFGKGVSIIDIHDSAIGKCSTEIAPVSTEASDLAYVIYTSGSTGQPKGVMINHQSVVNLFYSQQSTFEFGSDECVLQFSTIAFDASVEQIWLAFLTGNTLVLVDEDKIKDSEKFNKYLVDQGVTHLHATPSFLEGLELEGNNNLKRVIAGGEFCSPALAKKLSRYQTFHNEYGPTETTVTATVYSVSNSTPVLDKVPIGRPVGNTCAYILGASGELLPKGTVGEFYLSGDCLAMGYLNDQVLTEQRFINNPFVPGELMYKTGDLARWLPDGNLEFFGRADNQVKLRGYRIELDEVTASLVTYPGIQAGLAHVIEHAQNEKLFVGYYESTELYKPESIRAHLLDRLPEYMVPSIYVRLDAFPQTANGKIDKRALPHPNEDLLSSGQHIEGPINAIEQSLLEIWSEVLGIPQENISVTKNFFELGGDSIKSIQLASRIGKLGYAVSVQDIFVTRDIRNLSSLIADRVSIGIASREIDQGIVEGEVLLSPIQQWFFAQDLTDKHHYNQSVMLHFSEGLSREDLTTIFNGLLHHHDALRITYDLSGGNVLQWNQGEHIDLSSAITEHDFRESGDQVPLEDLCNKIQSGIDLKNGPLVKLGLFHQEDGSRLLIVIHHLIIDGLSWRILIEDLDELYKSLKTGGSPVLQNTKTDSYQYWCNQFQTYTDGGAFKSHASYWTSKGDAVTSLAADHELGENRIEFSEVVSLTLDEEATEKLLRQSNEAYGTQIQDLLLSALILNIYQQYGIRKLSLDLEGHGREELAEGIDVSRTIGWFTSLYPVLLQSGDDLPATIKNVKEALRAIPNKGFDYLIQKYSQNTANQDPGHAQLIFNYLGQFDSDLATRSFDITTESVGDQQGASNEMGYEWQLNGMVATGKLQLGLTYSNKRYNKKRIEEFMSGYKTLLLDLIEHCSSQEKVCLTPSDLTYKGLSIQRLDFLQSEYPLEDIYPLTAMQAGMFYYHLLDANSGNYFVQISYRLRGTLDPLLVSSSLDVLSSRYDILRAQFISDVEESSLQLILKEKKISVSHVNAIDEVSRNGLKETINSYREEDKARGFDLSTDSLMRVLILQTGEDEYTFIWSFHHILMDGWCLDILISEFNEIYQKQLQGVQVALPEVAPYGDYLRWLQNIDEQPSHEYWSNYLSGYEQTVKFPQWNSVPDESINPSKKTMVSISQKVSKSLQEMSHRHGITIYSLFQACWGMLLNKYNDAEDVVFGSVVSGRPSEISGVDRMIGLFINTIPVRVHVSNDDTVISLSKQIHETSFNGAAHHYYQLADIQKTSKLGSQLFDHILVYENYPIGDQIDQTGFRVEEVEVFEKSIYGLAVVIFPGESLRIKFQYDPQVYKPEAIDQLAGHFKNALSWVVEQEEASIGSYDCMPLKERKHLLQELNNTQVDFPEATVLDLFKEQVQKSPDSVAIEFEGTTLTYQELDRRSDILAAFLIEKEIASNAPIGILQEHSDLLVVSMLGVLKSGKSFIPIDTAYPDQRIHDITMGSSMIVLITTTMLYGEHMNALEFISFDNLVDIELMEFDSEAQVPDLSTVSLEDTAYTIYTSGSTGVPKGVMISHGALSNYMHWALETYIDEGDCSMALFTSIAFDLTVTSIFLPLLSGNSLFIYGNETQEPLVRQVCREGKAKVVKLTPSHLRLMSESEESLGSIRRVVVGGEQLENDLAQKVNALSLGKIEIYNEYGPTEATIGCVLHKFHPETDQSENVAIGRPVANVEVYVLDSNLKLSPFGAIGELYIGGKQLFTEYLGDEDQTKERLIANPYGAGKIYKTGDLVRYQSSGDLEFIGRVDDQVKLHGYRIELGEIAAHLRTYPGVDNCMVQVVEQGQDNEVLVGYYETEELHDPESIKAHLSELLPEYMIPSFYVGMTSFPLTTNGKVDKRALPHPDESLYLQEDYVASKGEGEEQMVKIWSEVLGLPEDKISVSKNFFELGGNSINMISLQNKIYGVFNVDLSLQQLLKYTVLRELVTFIESTKNLESEEVLDLLN